MQSSGGGLNLSDDGTLYVSASGELVAIQSEGTLATSAWPKFAADPQNRGMSSRLAVQRELILSVHQDRSVGTLVVEGQPGQHAEL